MPSNMYCQKCRTPLKLDGSLEDLNPAAFKLLADASNSPDISKSSKSRSHLPSYQKERLSEYDAAASNARPAAIKQSFVQPQRKKAAKDNPNMSFIMLTESQVLESPTPKSQKSAATPTSLPQSQQTFLRDRTEMAEGIFEVLSSRSDIDHPVCVECTEILVEGLQKRLVGANRERDAYIDFLRQANSDIPSEDEVRKAEKEYQKYQKEERAALADLKKLEAEKAALESEILSLDSVVQDLEIKEERFWGRRNEHFMELSKFRNERDRVNSQYEFDIKQLERFQRANVYNDTFSIGHDGYFGTINGLRLGRLPDRLVEWSEINAAWGHACLLLTTVAEKLAFNFYGYELKPMGSTSQIIEYGPQKPSGNRSTDVSTLEKKKVHELYTSGDYGLGMGLFNRKFDNAMIGFLECLRQLIVYSEKTKVPDANGKMVPWHVILKLNMPTIEKDMIGESSIKMGSWSQWTSACKLTLICCKYLLAHASMQPGAETESSRIRS